MAIRRVNPLSTSNPITDPKTGNPSPFFIRLWQQLFLNDNEITTLDQAISALFSTTITAGTGLSGGGDLSQDRTIDLDAGLDDLNDVDTTTTPPSDGQALIWDNANSVWEPGSVSGSGGMWWFDPPAASDFSTSVTTTSINSSSLTDDADVGMLLNVDHNGAGQHMRLKSAPTAPFVVTAKILFAHASGTSTPLGGLVMRDSSTGRFLMFGPNNNVVNMAVRRHLGSTFEANLGAGSRQVSGEPLWLRYVVAASGNVDAYWSGDGKAWHLWIAITAANAFGASVTPDQVGFGTGKTNSGSDTVSCSVQYYAET